MRNKNHIILLLALGLILAGTTSSSAAQRLRFRQAEPAPRQSNSSIDHDANHRDKALVRLQGRLSYSHRDGLRIDGNTILIGRQTSIHGASESMLQNLRRLSGEQVTVFGRRSPRGIRAELLLVRGSDGVNNQLMGMIRNEEGLTPSSVNPAVGSITEDAPQ